jgi:hypothetical protein
MGIARTWACFDLPTFGVMTETDGHFLRAGLERGN